MTRFLSRRPMVMCRWVVLSIPFIVLVLLGSDKMGTRFSLLSDKVYASSIHPMLAITAASSVAKGFQVEVLRSSTANVVTRPGVEISLQANFEAHAPLLEDAQLVLSLVDESGREVAHTENNLNNYLTILPTSRWVGPITIASTMTVRDVADGVYSIRLSLLGGGGPIQLTPGPGVTQDASFRYTVGAVRIAASAQSPNLLPAPQLKLTGYHLTFDEPFRTLSISDAGQNDGARWYARNEECCMSTTDGTNTAMVGVSSPQNPFSKMDGNGLNIRLQRVANSWTSGVLTSVDGVGKGFSQQYGYFEMTAKFPKGENTWPAFWLLNTASKSSHAPTGEIDIVEYIANPGFPHSIATTLHDWSNNTAPAASHYLVPLPTDGFHTYGMMWTASTMTFYFDGSITFQTPTPTAMKQPYYLLVDLGIGSGYPTTKTPFVNDMQIKSIRVYAKD